MVGLLSRVRRAGRGHGSGKSCQKWTVESRGRRTEARHALGDKGDVQAWTVKLSHRPSKESQDGLARLPHRSNAAERSSPLLMSPPSLTLSSTYPTFNSLESRILTPSSTLKSVIAKHVYRTGFIGRCMPRMAHLPCSQSTLQQVQPASRQVPPSRRGRPRRHDLSRGRADLQDTPALRKENMHKLNPT